MSSSASSNSFAAAILFCAGCSAPVGSKRGWICEASKASCQMARSLGQPVTRRPQPVLRSPGTPEKKAKAPARPLSPAKGLQLEAVAVLRPEDIIPPPGLSPTLARQLRRTHPTQMLERARALAMACHPAVPSRAALGAPPQRLLLWLCSPWQQFVQIFHELEALAVEVRPAIGGSAWEQLFAAAVRIAHRSPTPRDCPWPPHHAWALLCLAALLGACRDAGPQRCAVAWRTQVSSLLPLMTGRAVRRLEAAWLACILLVQMPGPDRGT